MPASLPLPVVSTLSRRRTAAGWIAAVVLPVAVGGALHTGSDAADLPLAALVLLASAVVVALIGGLLPALVAATLGFVVLNVLFTDPVGSLSVAQPRNVVVLVVFLGVAAGVATVVDLAARRAAEAHRARTEAQTLAALSRSVLTGQDTAEAVVERVRDTFAQDRVALLARTDDGWRVVAAAGPGIDEVPRAEALIPVDAGHGLALRGPELGARDRRALEGFAIQAGLVLEYRRLRDREERAVVLERAEATSTALLRAVSHDLRTPLATMRAAVDGLHSPGVAESDRRELVTTVADASGQLEHLIDDLLDLSRLQSDLVHPVMMTCGLDEVLPLAVSGHSPGAVRLDVAESTPLVRVDRGLLERVVANLVTNAVRANGADASTPVRVTAYADDDQVEIAVIDHGPGVPTARRPTMFEPFQRLGDAAAGGLGLGLAVARGLAASMGATVTAGDTPGGGLTMSVSVSRADLDDAGGDGA